MTLTALTGPGGADLTAAIETAIDGCAIPTELKKIQVKTFAADGTVASTRNINDAALTNGARTIDLGDVPRDRHVEADVLLQTSERTFVVRGATRTLLRPDLVVESVTAPKQVLAGRPFAVTVVIAERNKDVGAKATVVLPAAGVTRPVEIAAGGTATIEFPAVTLAEAGRIGLAAEIRNASPAQTDATNDTLATPVEVLRPPDLVVE
ncbi:MAG TPA: hypothetical protein VGJ77_21795, partial [Gaiellaceae bacterium]